MTIRLTFFIVAALFARTGFAQLFGDQHVLSSQTIPQGDFSTKDVYSADLDGDGDMDVLSATWGGNIDWFENLGGGLFGSEQIITVNVAGARSVHAADLDGDGDMDVLSASDSDDRIAWYENLGGGLFGPQNNITLQANYPLCAYATDLDGDGDPDVLVASYLDSDIAWYENLGGGLFSVEHLIDGQAGNNSWVHSSDLDADGDMDVLLTFNDNDVAWYENLGNGLFGPRQVFSELVIGPSCVYAADLDGDSDMDILTTSESSDKVFMHENLGANVIESGQVISDQANGASSVFADDLDLDGDMDVLSTSILDDKVSWYENLGGGLFGVQQIISTDADGPVSIHTADLDGDGDNDVLSASSWDSKIAWYENLTIIAGCMDPSACNYAPNANVGNSSCCYTDCGCTNPIAANYLESATCENGTCEFNITGTVFFDENENAVMDGNEYGLPFQTVQIEETGQTYITNDEGHFIASISQQQVASFALINSVTFPYTTTTNPQVFNADTSATTQLYFGVSNQMPDFGIAVDFYPDGLSFLCNDYTNFNICFRNLGNLPIDGIIELEYDPLFQGYQEVTPIDSVIGNFIYMSYENLLPGQMLFYDIELLTPTVDHIGEYVTNVAKVYGYYEGNQVAYGEKVRTMEITCAYDPNDKQAFPLGYTDQHLLLQETQQEFVIRFQNTGNAPAQNIRVQDTLNVNFDIESFRIIANSHSVMTTIDPETRLVDFYFENIQLPDSVSNEPASHGVISYMITPLPDLPVGTVLENTAYIYFDNNDPIITNTTWTTIHECGGESIFEPVTVLVCDQPQVNFANSYEFVEHYSWLVNGEEVGVSSELLITSIAQPNFEVTLTASNPLCTETTTLNYEVPDITSIDPCRADFNCDGNRDTQDLLVFMSEFGCLNTCAADLDDNAIVNVSDLFIFISVFDRMCWE